MSLKKGKEQMTEVLKTDSTKLRLFSWLNEKDSEN